MNTYIAYCGLDCETCEARLATVRDDDALRAKVAAHWSELNGVAITPEMINCGGCRIDGKKTVFCESLCPVRQCALEKQVQTCRDCPELPDCEKFASIKGDKAFGPRTLIVYFSLEGDTDYAARRIAAAAGADLLRLVPKKAYADKGFAKFLWGGKSAVMAERPALEPYEADLASYERIVFGFPVWASRFTPPLRTFIAEQGSGLKGKRIAAFACQSGGGAPKALAQLKEFLGIDAFEAEAVFIDPMTKRSDGTDAAIDAFARALEEKG